MRNTMPKAQKINKKTSYVSNRTDDRKGRDIEGEIDAIK